jgi:23S rRNA pseudouridine1911/1915/1917 synthase
MLRFVVEDEAGGSRIDSFLRHRTGLPRPEVQALLDAGRVRVDGRRVKKGKRIPAGSEVDIEGGVPSLAAVPDADVTLDIVHSDRWLVVLNKPAGQPCHPLRAGERGCLANGLVAEFPEMADVGYEDRQPGLVNRLDNETSGLVVAARDMETFASLRSLLRAGKIHKRYEAACALAVETGGTISLPLAQSPKDPRRVIWPLQPIESSAGVAPGRADGSGLAAPAESFKPAESHIVDCVRMGPHFRICVEAGAARRHQVRAHLAAIGAPLLGDTLYGGIALEQPGHLLHASRMVLDHPETGETLSLSAAPPDWSERLRVPSVPSVPS